MQSRLGSVVERIADLVTGFVISWTLQAWVLYPLFGIETSNASVTGITIILAVVSFIRGYCWRRIFNRYTIRENAIGNTDKRRYIPSR